MGSQQREAWSPGPLARRDRVAVPPHESAGIAAVVIDHAEILRDIRQVSPRLTTDRTEALTYTGLPLQFLGSPDSTQPNRPQSPTLSRPYRPNPRRSGYGNIGTASERRSGLLRR